MEMLAGMVKDGKEGTPEFAELKRRQGWGAGTGMRLHELYFANLGGNGDMAKAPNLMKKKQDQFGLVETCAKDFKATASMRGIGWVIMYQDMENGRLLTSGSTNTMGGTPPAVIPSWSWTCSNMRSLPITG